MLRLLLRLLLLLLLRLCGGHGRAPRLLLLLLGQVHGRQRARVPLPGVAGAQGAHTAHVWRGVQRLLLQRAGGRCAERHVGACAAAAAALLAAAHHG